MRKVNDRGKQDANEIGRKRLWCSKGQNKESMLYADFTGVWCPMLGVIYNSFIEHWRVGVFAPLNTKRWHR